MTDNNHPITPPPELVEQWYEAIDNSSTFWKQELATKAARWGADQELEACVEWVIKTIPAWAAHREVGEQLRAARRPKPKSQAEEALNALDDAMIGGHIITTSAAAPTIRAALERLRELEGSQ